MLNHVSLRLPGPLPVARRGVERRPSIAVRRRGRSRTEKHGPAPRMIVTRTSGSWSWARSASSSSTRSGVEIALRFSGRLSVMRRTPSAGCVDEDQSRTPLIDSPLPTVSRGAGEVGEQLERLGLRRRATMSPSRRRRRTRSSQRSRIALRGAESALCSRYSSGTAAIASCFLPASHSSWMRCGGLGEAAPGHRLAVEVVRASCPCRRRTCRSAAASLSSTALHVVGDVAPSSR